MAHPNVAGDSTAVLAAAAIGGALHRWWLTVMSPKLQLRRTRKQFQDGVPEIPGLRPAVPPDFARLANVESLAAATSQTVVTLSHSFDAFKVEVNEKFDALMDTITETLRVSESTNKEVRPNGGDGPSLGDTVARMAKRSGDYVEPTDVSYDRRATDREQ